jgi:hypothetical protein
VVAVGVFRVVPRVEVSFIPRVLLAGYRVVSSDLHRIPGTRVTRRPMCTTKLYAIKSTGLRTIRVPIRWTPVIRRPLRTIRIIVEVIRVQFTIPGTPVTLVLIITILIIAAWLQITITALLRIRVTRVTLPHMLTIGMRVGKGIFDCSNVISSNYEQCLFYNGA